MAIVNTSVPLTSAGNNLAIETLTRTYSDFRTEQLTTTAFQRPVRTLVMGNGGRRVLFTAAHHANEWITALILLKFAEDLGQAAKENGNLYGVPARLILQTSTIYMVPMVDPDGVDLVTGAIRPGSVQYEVARTLADRYPQIPFPEGWKANLLGVDLNLQYPAGWDVARRIKFDQGYTRPGPRDYVGSAPLITPENRAMAAWTKTNDFSLTLSYHTQGKTIYWQSAEETIAGAKGIGEAMSKSSGYALESMPYESGHAGYNDWFIQTWSRPGFTIEAGRGENPLSLSQFEEIYGENLPILIRGITLSP